MERNALIEAAYAEGQSLREIAKDHSISHERVRQVLKAAGVVLRTTPARQENCKQNGKKPVKL
jgi:DNA-directed RNA polymerase sigma subunit (sigma70/sigma32)